MRELLVDFITSVDGYASADGWPGWWGLQGPEYLAWLGEQPAVTYLMGATTAPSTAASSWSSTGPACSSTHRSQPRRIERSVVPDRHANP
jgi:hypothetical protein